jgi:chemotaxis protein CheZ
MSLNTLSRNGYARCIADMGQALDTGDDAAFRAAMAGFDALRGSALVSDVRKVATDLQDALQRFQVDTKLLDLAQRQMPDARLRLAQVLRLTDDAAHRTMDLVEQCGPLAVQTMREGERIMAAQAAASGASAPRAETDAFIRQAIGNMSAVRSKLSDVLVAQGFQDLSGQIIRSVMTLVGELESALGELLRIGGVSVPAATVGQVGTGAYGPVVPGVDHGNAVDGQRDVDALLSDLGM